MYFFWGKQLWIPIFDNRTRKFNYLSTISKLTSIFYRSFLDGSRITRRETEPDDKMKIWEFLQRVFQLNLFIRSDYHVERILIRCGRRRLRERVWKEGREIHPVRSPDKKIIPRILFHLLIQSCKYISFPSWSKNKRRNVERAEMI